MTILVVGGDNIASLRNELHAHGETVIVHWTGRRHGEKRNVIPRDTECIVILTDYVSHALAGKVKQAAKCRNIPVRYTRNSRCSMVTAACAQRGNV